MGLRGKLGYGNACTGYIVLDSIIFVYILLDDSNDLLPLDESVDYIVHRMAAAASLVRTYTDGIYGEREAFCSEL